MYRTVFVPFPLPCLACKRWTFERRDIGFYTSTGSLQVGVYWKINRVCM
jgi:hypothetical protein